MRDLEGKVALVTGASRGIGQAIAVKFAQSGAKVIVNYSSNEVGAQKTLELMGDFAKNAYIMAFDVSSREEVDRAVERILADNKSLDILVNNAGISLDGLILRLREEDFDRQISVNLKGAFNLSRACIRPMMKNRWGRIINISSIVGQMGNAGQSVYAAAKAGLIGMTKSLALELASRNILVNAITPGYIATDMTKEALEKGLDHILAQIPLKRVGEPKDIANAAAFLASSDADYITGQVLSVNGGIYI